MSSVQSFGCDTPKRRVIFKKLKKFKRVFSFIKTLGFLIGAIPLCCINTIVYTLPKHVAVLKTDN